MTKEEQKAIEYFEHKVKNKLPLYEETYINGKPYRRNILQLETNFTEEQANKTQIILNLISKLQVDIEIKDKVIDELINFLLNYDIDEDYCKKIERQECNKYKEGYCDKCIKQHFYKKVEEEKC